MGKTGRNSPCPCGSGKKYKKCCLSKDQEEERSQRLRSPEYAEEDEYFEDFPGGDDAAEPYDRGDRFDGPYTVDSQEPIEAPPVIDEGPDLTLPAISEEEERIVDQWWEEFRPYFRERDAEEMLRRIRKEHPEAYVHSFEYYDNDVIGELALTGRRNEIPEYFSFFKQYPGSDSGKLSEITDLLAVAGFDKELFELSHAVKTPIWQSPEMMDRHTISWLAFELYIPYLSGKEHSGNAVSRLIADMQKRSISENPQNSFGAIQAALECAANGPQSWDITKCGCSEHLMSFYDDIAWGFCGFLANRKNLSWVSSIFLAHLLNMYLRDIPSGKRPRKAFDFRQNMLNQHIIQRYFFFGLQGVPAISLLRSIWYFTDYLVEQHVIEDAAAEKNRQNCMRVFELCRKGVDSTDFGPRLYAAFPDTAIPAALERPACP